MKKTAERISRGRQIVKLWHTLNFDEVVSERDTLVDMLADLYHYCQSNKIVWTDVISAAERWGIEESMANDESLPSEDEVERRLLKAIFDNDPLSVNDPDDEDEGCGKWGCKDCYPDD